MGQCSLRYVADVLTFNLALSELRCIAKKLGSRFPGGGITHLGVSHHALRNATVGVVKKMKRLWLLQKNWQCQCRTQYPACQLPQKRQDEAETDFLPSLAFHLLYSEQDFQYLTDGPVVSGSSKFQIFVLVLDQMLKLHLAIHQHVPEAVVHSNISPSSCK